MLRVWLCGRIAAELDGDPLTMPSGDRALALIGWLALNPGRHPRAGLAARLWPDVPEASARASLRTAVWSIRQSWGGPATEEVLEVSRNSIGLRAERVWVDALDSPPVAAGEPVAEGELLAGIDDDWARIAREEHRERQSRRLEELAAAAGQDGRDEDAVRWSRRRCALSPLDESAHRDLLRRLEAAGDHAGAVLAARQFADLLRSELGVRPSPATRAAQSRLQPASSSGSSSRVRLFGRSAEIATLTRLWRSAADGAGQVVVLTGEAGIGKTSLLAELAHRVGAAGGRTAIGTGIDVGGETPFAVWLELARSLVTTVAPVPAAVAWPAELSRLSPELGYRLGRTQLPVSVAAPEIERLRVFESVLRLVEWSCADRPALIALDDAHSADRASLRLTAHIGRRLAGLPVLLLLARRDRPSRSELDALLADLAGRSLPVTELEIEPIGDRDVAALASSSLRLGDDDLRRVVAAAEGNPLLAVESTRALAAGGQTPPPNLRTAVRATLGRLPGSGQSLARLLAVAGRPLSGPEIDALAVADLAGAVEAGIDGGLLVRHPGGRLGFRHALLREVVYADLPDSASLHARVAAALDQDDRAEIARHLMLAGHPLRAAREWAAAASYARSVGALTEAADFLVRATECSPGDGSLWLELVEVCAWLGRNGAMEQAWDRALARLPAVDLPAAWCQRGRQLRSVVCRPEASFAAYSRAETLLTPQTPDRVRADVLIGLAWSHAVAGDPSKVDPLLAEAGGYLPPEADPHVVTDIAEIRIQGLIRQGRFAECAQIALSTEMSQAPLPDRAYAVWVNAACALTCAGDHEGALAMADRAIAATESVPVVLVPCLAARAHLLARLGRAEEAIRTVEQQREYAARLDAPQMIATAAHDAGLVALEVGHYARAAQLLGEALSGAAKVSRPSALLSRAEALARSGDPEAAAAALRAAVLEPVGRADQPWSLVPRMTGVQGLIAAARGDLDQASSRYDEAAEGWRRMLPTASRTTADGYLANLVDLGRPPVVGLIEPARELERLERDRAALAASPAAVAAQSADRPR
jgi:DNA-binding SARP family transcriptional activator/tetratricopeptide (TPR) repeat protein